MVLTGWQPTENWLSYNTQITQGSLKEFRPVRQGSRGGLAGRTGQGHLPGRCGQAKSLPQFPAAGFLVRWCQPDYALTRPGLPVPPGRRSRPLPDRRRGLRRGSPDAALAGPSACAPSGAASADPEPVTAELLAACPRVALPLAEPFVPWEAAGPAPAGLALAASGALAPSGRPPLVRRRLRCRRAAGSRASSVLRRSLLAGLPEPVRRSGAASRERVLPVSPMSSSDSASRPARARWLRGSTPVAPAGIFSAV